jgi:hypothetical protein
MKRLILPWFIPAVCCVGLTAGPAGAAKDQVAWTVDPAYFERKINRIAILDVITPSGADERVLEMETMIQAALQEQGDFDLIFPSDFQAAADRGGAKEAWETLHRVWHSRREIEGPSLHIVTPATTIDAIIGAEVTHFEQYKIDYTQEGYSTTTVGLKIQMFDAHDKKLLWQASMIHTAKSPPYNPAGYLGSDAGGGTVQTGKGVPNPPEYDDTSEKVVNAVINTFPKVKDLKNDKKKSKKEDTKKKEEAEEGSR